MRPKTIIKARIIDHLLKAHLKTGDSFTLAEDMIIVNHVLKNRIPKEPNDIKTFNSEKKNWISLESELERKPSTIQKRWHGVIYPRILAHLYGTGNLDWKKNFFQYIIDNKFVAVAHIDENDVEKKWPSVPKQKLFKAALDFSKSHGEKELPIYQNISENIHRLKPQEPPQETLDFNEALEEIGIKPFSKLRK